jgi:hypothetical protein
MGYFLPQIEHMPVWPVVSGTVFFMLFLGLVCWVYKGSRKAEYDETAHLPLDSED